MFANGGVRIRLSLSSRCSCSSRVTKTRAKGAVVITAARAVQRGDDIVFVMSCQCPPSAESVPSVEFFGGWRRLSE